MTSKFHFRGYAQKFTIFVPFKIHMEETLFGRSS